MDELVSTGAMRALTSSINAEVGSITVPEGGMANNGGTVTNGKLISRAFANE